MEGQHTYVYFTDEANIDYKSLSGSQRAIWIDKTTGVLMYKDKAGVKGEVNASGQLEVLIGDIDYNYVNANGAGTQVIIKPTAITKTSGYKVVDGYIKTVQAFANDGAVNITNANIGIQNSSAQTASVTVGKYQILDISNLIFRGLTAIFIIGFALSFLLDYLLGTNGLISMAAVSGAAVKIDSAATLNMQLRADANFDTVTWTAGKIEYYIVLQKAS